MLLHSPALTLVYIWDKIMAHCVIQLNKIVTNCMHDHYNYQNPPLCPPFYSSPLCLGSRSKAAAARHLRGSPVFTFDYHLQLKLAALSAWLPFQRASLYQPLPRHYCQQLYPSQFSAPTLTNSSSARPPSLFLSRLSKTFPARSIASSSV